MPETSEQIFKEMWKRIYDGAMKSRQYSQRLWYSEEEIENLTKHNSRTIQSAVRCPKCSKVMILSEQEKQRVFIKPAD